MPRISSSNALLRELVDSRLVPLVLAAGSVNKACDILNTALTRRGTSAKIYPNRLHSILLDDPHRTINESSVKLIQEATGSLESDFWSDAKEAERKIGSEVAAQWRVSSQLWEEIPTISDAVGCPVAIVRVLLQRMGLLPMQSEAPRVVLRPHSQISQTNPSPPDFSFQEIAIRRCRDALNRGPARRAALVSPTGSGKTEMGIRIALEQLHAHPDSSALVLWVTHRRNLRTQARIRLQKMIARGVPNIPNDAAKLLAQHVHFLMVQEVDDYLRQTKQVPILIIVDEAHHGAAPSYNAVFEAVPPTPILALTATPNRTDGLPIRIDEIAYTVTYKELVDRNVILMPEFVPFPVNGFDWGEDAVRDLADHLVENADRYQKVLIIAPQISRVEQFYNALVQRVATEADHPLELEDIGFIHSQANSAHASADLFIAEFREKNRGILVSAQMLLEGFDDPRIDTVVITYPTESLITLMQAVGRCVRHHPDKPRAYVIQAKDERAAYYFEQRWLYQDLTDFPRPVILDVEFDTSEQLVSKLREVLCLHNVPSVQLNRIVEEAAKLNPGASCKLLLAGIPFLGNPDDFEVKGEWRAALITSSNEEMLRSAFNEFCALGRELVSKADLKPIIADLARRYRFQESTSIRSEWRFLVDLFRSIQNAVSEVHGYDSASYFPGGRPRRSDRATSWLKYITFQHRPALPDHVRTFLSDCFNREHVGSLLMTDDAWNLIVKLPLPFDGFEAHLLNSTQSTQLTALRERLNLKLRSADPSERVSTFASEFSRTEAMPFSTRLGSQLLLLTRESFWGAHTLQLKSPSTIKEDNI